MSSQRRFTIGRRTLARAGLSGAGIWIARRARAQESPWAKLLEEYTRVRPATFTTPLPIPPVLAPARSDAAGDHYELAIKRGTAQPVPGAPTAILGYGGVWPGPTIVATRGRAARVRVSNQVDASMSVHNHGHNVAADSDGHPLDYIRPGASKEYVYPNAQSAGTYWYHDHAFGLTGAHVYRGLAGLYIIRDPAEEALGLPAGAYDVPLVLQDRLLDANNQLSYEVNAGTVNTGFLGNTLCVNGVHAPVLDVAARRYRLRVLNGSNARTYKLVLGSGDPMLQIASDGSLLDAPVARSAVEIAASERCDLVVDFSRYPVGTSVMLRNTDPTWPNIGDVMRFHVKRKEPDPSRVPERLATIARLDQRKARVRRRITFQLSDGKWTLNGLRYDPARIDIRPRLGTTEVWELVNAEPTQLHPFHQHLVPFQVLDLNGRPPPPELRGWKDTVAVPPHGSARIIMRFEGFRGTYVFHCHKLEHEDHAMMLQEEVVG